MMKKFDGNPDFPMWLLGDSEPDRWRQQLEYPLDHRHPIRHNIWTSVIDVTQDQIFLALGRRFASSKMFVRNAVQNSKIKPSKPFNPSLVWHKDALASLDEYRQLIAKHKPKIVISFGVFAFAFALRSIGDSTTLPSTESQSRFLGSEFRRRVSTYDATKTNVFPLLHRSIAGGRFLAGHSEFCGTDGANYFEEAGRSIAGVLIKSCDDLDCWLSPCVAAS